MKRKILSIIFVCFAVINFTCKKHSVNPVDTLPPATQTGANTFGCLINGKAFTPGGSSFSPPHLFSYYQNAYPTISNAYVFDVSAGDLRNTCNITGITFGVDSVISLQPGIYKLGADKANQGGGGYNREICNGGSGAGVYHTNDSIGGQLTITRFDLTYQIASGTFWFNVLDNNGDTVKITDGRFDVRFTE
jgi:hypothetical protein